MTILFCFLLFDTTSQPMSYRQGWNYQPDFYKTESVRTDISTPSDILGFQLGSKAATPEEIIGCVQTWVKQSPLVSWTEYAKTYEGRPLGYLTITAQENRSRLPEIQKGITQLADPRTTSEAQAQELIQNLPGVAWLAYSIHGNETSGADAALAIIYHLIADTSEPTQALLKDLVILIDPLMNPDGRARFCQKMEEQRGASPNFDSQSLKHTGEWPGGRTNHYYFDLNRDFILAVNPETKGRIQSLNPWYPQLFVDAHEMGSMGTFLMSPARQPLNPNRPPYSGKWHNIFATDQAHSLDQKGWTYYSGEWNEDWYPGYSFWCLYRGSLTILYEQARIAEDAIKRPENTYVTYPEAIHHQYVSSMSNLETLQQHYKEMRGEFWKDRKWVLSSQSPYAKRSWVLFPTENHSRMKAFLDILDIQDFEYKLVDKTTPKVDLLDQLGKKQSISIPEGSILIPNLQPEARLLSAMLEFDPHMSQEVLAKERRQIMNRKGSLMYDATGWSLTMMYDLEAYSTSEDLTSYGAPLNSKETDKATAQEKTPLGWMIQGDDDEALKVAAKCMEEGLQVRVATKAFEWDGQSYSRGAILVLKGDNPEIQGNSLINDQVSSTSLTPIVIKSGMGEGDLPDLGGQYFPLLERPQIALMGHGKTSPGDFGTLWYSLDHFLGIRHSHLRETSFNWTDLRRYNVLILPSRRGSLPKEMVQPIMDWVRSGGTLITVGNTSGFLCKSVSKDIKTQLLDDSLESLDKYELALYRQWEGLQKKPVQESAVWTHQIGPWEEYPWSDHDKRPAKDELKRRDEWDRLFMPQGAILACQTDPESWLTMGCRTVLPILFGNDPILLSEAEVPVRLGVLTQAMQPQKGKTKDVEKSKDTRKRTGWATLPEGKEITLRMSGLLWPEAARRIANAAWTARESVGKGQIIFFASSPNFRGSTLGSNRVFLNAVVLGPGLGTDPIVRLD